MINANILTPGDEVLDTGSSSQEQYLRKITLQVFGTDFTGLDLSNLRIKFSVKRSETATPNTADIRIYNVEDQTALSILIALSPPPGLLVKNVGQVLLQGGYESNYGVIFKGNIKQVILGRESATDTFVDIVAGDGDRAYNFAVVNSTLAAGSTQADQISAATNAMISRDVSLGHVGAFNPSKLPRGKVLYGNARNYLRNVAQNTKQSWSIQDGQVTFIPLKSYLPGEAVLLTSKTGLIGTPQQTNIGINAKCLINPLIKIGSRIDLSEATIEHFKINLTAPGNPVNNSSNASAIISGTGSANIPSPLNLDGVYYVFGVEHSGDTRAIEWYTTIICLTISPTTNPANSVQVGYG